VNFKQFSHIFPYIFIILLIIFESIGQLFARSNTVAYTVDLENTPISYVTVFNNNNGCWIIGDADGQIIFTSRFSPGDSLEFQRIGYIPFTTAFPSGSNSFQIILYPSPIELGKVEIHARTEAIQNKMFAEVLVLPEMGVIESGQALSTLPGTYIKSYGGPAGISSLSLDGAPSSHTNIFFAGFDLTSAQNGQMDISQLPSSLVKNISYTPNLDLKNPEHSNAEGSIEIQPEWSKTGIVASIGSYGHSSITANLNIHSGRYRSYFTSGQRLDLSNYRVQNPVTEEYLERDNNDFKQQFFASTTSIIFSTQMFLDALILHSSQIRGVAGLVWSPTPDARRSDRLTMIGSKLGWVNHFGYGYLQLLIKTTNDHFVNPQNRIDTKHTLYNYQALIKQNLILSQRLNFLLYVDSNYDLINSMNTEIHDRISYKFLMSGNYSLLKAFFLKPSISINYSPGLYIETDHDFQTGYKFHSDHGMIYLGTGKFFRFPSFNDLYWKPGGNPDLKPEYTDKLIGGFDLKFDFGFSINSLLYYKTSKDLILWTPLQSYWQPKNIQQAIRKGYKVILDWQNSSIPIILNAQYNYNISEDRTPGDYYKKPLRYAPKITSSFSVSWRPQHFSFFVQLNHVSRRIATYSWPEDQFISPYIICSLSASYTFMSRFGNIIVTTAVNNLSDFKYETLLGYPEPSRSFRLSINYEIN